MYYKLKLKGQEKYLAGEMCESILMLIEDKNRSDVILLDDFDIEDLSGDMFIDELTLDEIEFDDLEKIKV